MIGEVTRNLPMTRPADQNGACDCKIAQDTGKSDQDLVGRSIIAVASAGGQEIGKAPNPMIPGVYGETRKPNPARSAIGTHPAYRNFA